MSGLRGDRQVRDEDGLVVDFDQERVFARLGKGQVADFVDEIDLVKGAVGFEGSFEKGLGMGVVESHGNSQLVLSRGAIRDRHEPDHEGVGDGEFARLDVGEDAENRVLARAGIDVDAVTHEPGQELRFGIHPSSSGPGVPWCNLFLLGVGGLERLGGHVQLAQVTSRTIFVDLSEYPPWLLVLVGTLAAVLILWILIKVLKWALWLLLFCVLIGGLCWSGWLLVQ